MQENAVCRLVWAEWFPFRRWIYSITRKTFLGDLFAGLTGAMIVLPQGVAFAAIAGLPPQYGLYTAIVPAIIAALFGSSFHLVSGPTTAISIMVFSTLAPIAEPGSAHYIQLALTLTFMVGAFQLAMGLARMGTLVNFVSHSVVVGFTAGAAVLIAGSQLKHLVGITLPRGLDFTDTIMTLALRIGETNPYELGIGLFTLGLAALLQYMFPRWPNMLTTLVAGAGLAAVLGAEAHGVRMVAAFPGSLPPLSSPTWTPHLLRDLTSGALAVALLGLIEAVSIARSVALRSNQELNGNQEFIGQGLSNMVGSFFSSYASSGSFTRSGINFRAGAKTPLAAIFASLTLLTVVLIAAPLAGHLPITSMAGVILMVAYNLVDVKHIRSILRTSRNESLVLVATCLSTLFVELEFAIYVGVIMSLVHYLSKAATPKVVSRLPSPHHPSRMFVTDSSLPECPQLKIIRIDGSLFFGAVPSVRSSLQCLMTRYPDQKYFLVVATGIHFVDVAGVEFLLHFAKQLRKRGGDLFIYDVKKQVCSKLRKSGLGEELGQNHIFQSKAEAVQDIVTKHLNQKICLSCPNPGVFLECQAMKYKLVNSNAFIQDIQLVSPEVCEIELPIKTPDK
ncbi:MAG: SulP family inorganic anion transporter [Magnetococcales bacterium]|nr:SulP family inorganic anion transporter [Magnetococcales bacterium]